MVTYTFTNGTVADATEVNQNFIDVQKNIAQLPFTTLKSTGQWENEGNLAADRTTVAEGVNDTINTGSSNSSYDLNTKKYILNIAEDISSDTTYNPDSFTNVANAFDNNDTTYAELNPLIPDGTNANYYLGKTFTSKTIGPYKIIASIHDVNNVAENIRIDLQTYDGSTWTTLDSIGGSDIFTANFSGEINTPIQGIRLGFFIDNNSGASDASIENKLYYFSYGSYQSDSILIIDSNTLTLSGNENTISVYSSSSIPSNTNIKCTLNDGTQDISNEITLSENQTSVIPLTATPTAGNTLELHYTLETTDSSKTPEWYGYGVSKL